MKKIFVFVVVLSALLSACGGSNEASAKSSAPDFELPNALGSNVSLKDYEGRNVLLFFHMAVG